MEGDSQADSPIEERTPRVFNFSASCTYIEKQEVIVQAGATFYNGPKPEEDGDNDDNVIQDLLPFFYGDEEEVRKFVRIVKGAKAQEVTQQVNMLLRAKKISDKTCSKPLYDVLFKYGLYDKTYSNWSAYLIKI